MAEEAEEKTETIKEEEKVEDVKEKKPVKEKKIKEKPKKGVKTHVSEEKKQKVKDLAELMKKKTVMVVSIKGLPSAQFQDIKKKLRGKAQIQVAKKSLIDFALDHSGIKELHDLVPYVKENTAILFSDKDAFEISGVLASEKSPAKAKEGQESPEDIEVKAGPTSLLPGPDISALSAVGLIPKVEAGKIAIVKDSILVKQGEKISANQASIMAKLEIIPFKIGIEPVAAFSEGKVYADIKIDKEAALEELQEAFGRGLAFAVELGYVCGNTLTFVLGKAAAHESAINDLIKEDKEEPKAEEKEEEVKEEEKPVEEKKEETNTDEVKADEAVTESQK